MCRLDLTLTRRSRLDSVKRTRAYHSADCDTDHSLVISKVQLSPQKKRFTAPAKQKATPKIDVTGTTDPKKLAAFRQTFEEKSEIV